MRALLIEDEDAIAEVIQIALDASGIFNVRCADGEQGLSSLLQDDFDVLILDLMLPKVSGLKILETARLNNIDIPVIILSAKGELSDKLLGFSLGAEDYLAKPFSPHELLARVKVLASRRGVHPHMDVLTVAGLTLNTVLRRAKWENAEVTLSNKEFCLLECLMRSPGHIFSRKQLLELVWHINFEPTTNVVDVCVQRLRRKLSHHNEGIEGLPLETIRGVGYRVVQN